MRHGASFELEAVQSGPANKVDNGQSNVAVAPCRAEACVPEPPDGNAPSGQIEGHHDDLDGEDEGCYMGKKNGLDLLRVLDARQLAPRKRGRKNGDSGHAEDDAEDEHEEVEAPELAPRSRSGEGGVFFREAQDKVFPEGGACWSIHSCRFS